MLNQAQKSHSAPKSVCYATTCALHEPFHRYPLPCPGDTASPTYGGPAREYVNKLLSKDGTGTGGYLPDVSERGAPGHLQNLVQISLRHVHAGRCAVILQLTPRYRESQKRVLLPGIHGESSVSDETKYKPRKFHWPHFSLQSTSGLHTGPPATCRATTTTYIRARIFY